MASAARTFAALVGLLLLGLAAAHALAPGDAVGAISPTLTVPTVPTVSVPLPLPTVPTLPPPPTTQTPVVPAVTAPVKAGTPSVSGAATGGSAPASGSAPAGSQGSAPQSEAGPSRARVTQVRARPIREQRTERRGVVLVFRLSEPDRVVFLVDGPTPSCSVVARFAVQGREGVNRVRFFGVVQGRRLAPGTYLLRPRVDGAGPRGATVTVLGGERPSAVPGPRDARCEERQAGALFVSAAIRQARLERGQPAEEAPAGVRGQEREEQDDERSVAPLPPPTAEDGALPGLVGIAILVLGAASLLFVVGYVVHFLRAN